MKIFGVNSLFPIAKIFLIKIYLGNNIFIKNYEDEINLPLDECWIASRESSLLSAKIH